MIGKIFHRKLIFSKIRYVAYVFILILVCYAMIGVDQSPRMNFDGFNNETGASTLIVPNLIHFIRLNKSQISFTDLITIRAAYLAQKPDSIYIHTDIKSFHGKYWNTLQRKCPETYKLIRFIPTEVPSKIFNHSISKGWKYHHASDWIRFNLLAKYGGIYMDNDLFLIKNLDKYRKFEMTLEWNLKQFMGNQLLIAHKDARFLRNTIETFRDYRSDRWYYNGGELPTTAVLYKHPEFIHRVIEKFGTNTGLSSRLFTQNWKGWKDYDAIHVLLGHRIICSKTISNVFLNLMNILF